MDQSVRNLLNKKMKLGGQELNVSDVLLLAVITVLAVWVRTAVRSFVAQDWTDYWSLWLEELRAGGFKALAGNFYDYASSHVSSVSDHTSPHQFYDGI